jgi:HEAT repeat protein
MAAILFILALTFWAAGESTGSFVMALIMGLGSLGLSLAATLMLIRLGESVWAMLVMFLDALAGLTILLALVSLILHGADKHVAGGEGTPAANAVGTLSPVDQDLAILACGEGRGGASDEELRAAADRLLTEAPAARRAEVCGALEPYAASPDPALRRRAVQALAWQAPTNERLVGLLLERAQDPDADVRAAALGALGPCRTPRVLEALLAHLTTDFEPAAAALKSQGVPARDALLSLLHQADAAPRIAAARALGVLGDVAALPDLRQAAKDADPRVAGAARDAWRRLAPQDFDELTDALTDLLNPATRLKALQRLTTLTPPAPNDIRRVQISATLTAQTALLDTAYGDAYADAIARWQTPDTAGALIGYLHKADPPLGALRRHAVILALARLGDPAAAPALAGCLLEDPAAENGLVGLGAGAEGPLLERLANTDDELVWKACDLLGRIGSADKARPALEALAKSTKNPALAAAARRAAEAIAKRNS